MTSLICGWLSLHLLKGPCCVKLGFGDGVRPEASGVSTSQVFQAGQMSLHRRLDGVGPHLQHIPGCGPLRNEQRCSHTCIG